MNPHKLNDQLDNESILGADLIRLFAAIGGY